MIFSFYVLVMLCAIQRLWEIRISRLHQAGLLKEGYRRREKHARLLCMVALHLSWFPCMVAEQLLWKRELPYGVALTALAFFLLAQSLRLWVQHALGRHWNISIMNPVDGGPGSVVISGPYRFIRHPNYLAVVIEIASLPLIGGAVFTALIFSVLNALVLKRRIIEEESALFERAQYRELMGGKGRFIPRFGSNYARRQSGNKGKRLAHYSAEVEG